MDYEKKYNEAFAWIRDIYPTLTGAAKEDAEHYFPELRESEDERMMKNIRLALLSVEDAFWRTHGLTAKEAISYLEKQKEQKLAEWSEEDETAFGDLLWCIEQARHSAKDENDMGNIWYAEKWLKERLKSLRPSWKQSEEQMTALARATNRCVSVKDANTLLGLLNQIKNL